MLAHGRMETPTNKKGPGRAEGFSLLEVVVALAVVSVALLGFSKAILDSMVLSQMNRESGLARRAAQQVLADIEATDFSEVFARYNAYEGDDLAGDNLPGAFEVEGLRLLDGDADGLAGEIVFPDDVAWDGSLHLREDSQLARLGMPMDLNLDGDVDTEDHADDYQVLPVLVRVEWRGRGGPAKVEFQTVLIEP